MKYRVISIALGMSLTVGVVIGCIHTKPKIPEETRVTAPFERYIASDYDWSTVKRIVLMPFANQVAVGYPRVGEEIQSSLATELQRAGRFDIVVATETDPVVRAQDVFATGRFNELELLRVARAHQADAVMFANVTQYHPYSPPRVGLSLLIVSPTEGFAIASASGLWDGREKATADLALAYYKRTQSFPRSLLGSDRMTESPNSFQRFVCHQLAIALQPAASGGMNPFNSSMPQNGMMPQNGIMYPGTTMPQGTMMPQVAPTPLETTVPQGGFMPQEGIVPNNNYLQPIPPASVGVP